MRTIVPAALIAATALASSPAWAQSGQCINTRDIAETVASPDGATLTFRMTNGTSIVNHLKPLCDSLKWGGFSWVKRPGGDVCSGAQVIRAFATGELCRLGQFDAPVKISRR